MQNRRITAEKIWGQFLCFQSPNYKIITQGIDRTQKVALCSHLPTPKSVPVTEGQGLEGERGLLCFFLLPLPLAITQASSQM